MTDETKNLCDVILATFQLCGLFIAAIWTYFRFFREGVHKPRIEFDILCTPYEQVSESRGLFFTIQATNVGKVEHKFTRITLKVRGIKSDQSLTQTEDGRWNFPESLCKAELVPEKYGYFFVRPDITQIFSFPTIISSDINYILARAAFKYEGSDDLHTVEKVFALKDRF